MIDGIDYYPRKKARSKKRVWLWLPVLLVAGAYYVFETLFSRQINDNTAVSITLSEPESTAVEPVEQIELNQGDISIQAVDNKPNQLQLERLDQVIETYRQKQWSLHILLSVETRKKSG